jgi:hypothetical protein
MDMDQRQAAINLLIAGIILAVVGSGIIVWQHLQDNKPGKPSSVISSFEDCVKAGNPVMDSYPEQCAADGQTFTNTDQAQTSTGAY